MQSHLDRVRLLVIIDHYNFYGFLHILLNLIPNFAYFTCAQNIESIG